MQDRPRWERPQPGDVGVTQAIRWLHTVSEGNLGTSPGFDVQKHTRSWHSFYPSFLFSLSLLCLQLLFPHMTPSLLCINTMESMYTQLFSVCCSHGHKSGTNKAVSEYRHGPEKPWSLEISKPFILHVWDGPLCRSEGRSTLPSRWCRWPGECQTVAPASSSGRRRKEEMEEENEKQEKQEHRTQEKTAKTVSI